MRRPRRARNVAIVLMLAGVAGIVVAVAMGPGHPARLRREAAGIVGATVAFFALLYGFYAQYLTVRRNRLVRGEGLLARWRVDAERWRAFVELNERLNRADGAAACPIGRRGESRPGGVEVLIGDSLLIVGDDCYPLRVGGFIEAAKPSRLDGPPSCLEFRVSSYDADGPMPRTRALRVPIAAGAEAQAESVCRRHAKRGGP